MFLFGGERNACRFELCGSITGAVYTVHEFQGADRCVGESKATIHGHRDRRVCKRTICHVERSIDRVERHHRCRAVKLNDTSRKLLRVIYNTRGVPPIAELARMASRTTGQVKMGLRGLAVEGYINYDPNKHYELKIIQAWEARPEDGDVRVVERRMVERELYPNR